MLCTERSGHELDRSARSLLFTVFLKIKSSNEQMLKTIDELGDELSHDQHEQTLAPLEEGFRFCLGVVD